MIAHLGEDTRRYTFDLSQHILDAVVVSIESGRITLISKARSENESAAVEIEEVDSTSVGRERAEIELWDVMVTPSHGLPKVGSRLWIAFCCGGIDKIARGHERSESLGALYSSTARRNVR